MRVPEPLGSVRQLPPRCTRSRANQVADRGDVSGAAPMQQRRPPRVTPAFLGGRRGRSTPSTPRTKFTRATIIVFKNTIQKIIMLVDNIDHRHLDERNDPFLSNQLIKMQSADFFFFFLFQTWLRFLFYIKSEFCIFLKGRQG